MCVKFEHGCNLGLSLRNFLFVGDLNGHHQEWVGTMTTNRHLVAAFVFATVSGCDQLVVGPTHERGGTLYLLMTDANLT